MKKTTKIIFICIIFLMGLIVFGKAGTLDDLERARKDMERSLKNDNLRNLEYQRKYQLPDRQTKTFTQDLAPRDQRATDRAVVKNQERLKKMLDEQKKGLAIVADSWGFVIPKEYRFIVELLALGLFISFFSFMFYRQNIRRREEEKREADFKKDQSLYQDE